MLLQALSSGETAIVVILALVLLVAAISVFGAVVFAALRRKSQRTRAAWAAIAPKLGLVLPEPKHLRMTGIFKGFETLLCADAKTTGGMHAYYFTFCEIKFHSALGRKLKIASRGTVFDLGASGSPSQIEREFDISCRDVHLVRDLLYGDGSKVPDLAHHMILTRREFASLSINDDAVRVEVTGHTSSEAVMRRMLDVAVYLADSFSRLRKPQ